MIPRNPVDGVKLPKIDNDVMKVLNEEELRIFKEAIKDEPEWYDFFYTEITTGLRKGEICGLMWSDFDAKTGVLNVRRTLHRYEDGQLRTGETKTGAGKRKILLPITTAQLLRERKKKSYSQWIFWNPLRPEDPISPDSAYHAMKSILQKAELPDIRFHDLRHTFATLALQTGADVKTVSSMLGHYSAGFTLDTYTHVTNHMQLQAADKMGSFMDTALPETAPTPPEPPENSECKVIPFEMVG